MEKTRRGAVRWTKVRKELFLDHLAGTCNVKASASAAGVNWWSVYSLRRRDAAFAAAWREALIAGYDLLETELVGFALAGGGRGAGDREIETAGARIDVDTALRLLSSHRGKLSGKARHEPQARRATREETDAAILKKLDAMERARNRDGGQG